MLVILVTSVIATLVTLWRSGGVPDARGEMYFYTWALSWGAPQALACLVGTLIVKVFDTIACTVLVGAFYCILPKKLKFPPAQAAKESVQ